MPTVAGSSTAGRRAGYVAALRSVGSDPGDMRRFLSAHSNLPGPRANLELARAVADWAPDELVDSLAGEQDEFLLFCAVLALGERLARAADPRIEAVLREHARDPRWRIREGVATGLQRVGDRELPRLCALVRDWAATDDPLVKRAAAAAICEPRLLVGPPGAPTALAVCSRVTSWIAVLPPERRPQAEVRSLRKALGYCWSVAIVADPADGLPAFELLRGSEDPDVRWIVRENEGKARMRKVLAERQQPHS